MDTLAAARTRPQSSLIAWLPLALLVAYAGVAAAGISLTPSSVAASATGDVDVNATVQPEVHFSFGACGAGGAASRTITGASMPTSAEDVQIGTCGLTFGSNNNGATGATLWIESGRPSLAAAGNSFCMADLTSTCAAPTFADVATTGVSSASFANADAGSTGAFAVRLTSTGCNGGAWVGTDYYGLPQDFDGSAGSQVCATGSTSDADLDFSFRANPGPSQTAGAYQLRAKLTAQAS